MGSLGKLFEPKVRIKYYPHLFLFSDLIFLSLFTKPGMEVHLVDFVKPLLVKDTLIPKLLKMSIRFLDIILAHKLLEFTKFFLAVVPFEHSQQRQLDGIKICNFHNNLIYFNAQKYKIIIYKF